MREFPSLSTISLRDLEKRTLRCVGALTGVDVCDLSKLSARDVAGVWVSGHEKNTDSGSMTVRTILRMKYGCTSGRCVGGFLSPRMLFATHCVAERASSQLFANLDDHWSFFSDGAAQHFPQAVGETLVVSSSMKRGLVALYEHVANCLEEHRLPTEENILDFYLNRAKKYPSLEDYLE